MTHYIFKLEKFNISKTRSRFRDTDAVTFALQVGNQTYQPFVRAMGDLADGEYTVDMAFGPIYVQPSDSAIFSYIIVNSGYDSSDQGTVKDVTNTLSTAAAAITNRFVPGLGTVGDYLMHQLHNIFYADCDGVVAADKIMKSTTPGEPILPLTGADLESWTAVNGVYTETRPYAGTDSPVGCGENSLYYVTWSVSRVEPPSDPILQLDGPTDLTAPFKPPHTTLGNYSITAIRLSDPLTITWQTDGKVAIQGQPTTAISFTPSHQEWVSEAPFTRSVAVHVVDGDGRQMDASLTVTITPALEPPDTGTGGDGSHAGPPHKPQSPDT